MTRSAIITAAVVEVECPHCGEPQPNKEDGSHLWTADMLRVADGQTSNCSGCDEPIRILSNRPFLAPF